MRVLLIEDEALAAERLRALILQYNPRVEIVAQLDSVADTVQWLASNAAPDLAFFDIHLADGLSFEIFERSALHCPIIFTTAYDAYALKAFKVNGIDYLLKPIDYTELEHAFQRYEQLRAGFSSSGLPEMDALQKVMQQLVSPGYKNRFVVKNGQYLHAVQVQDVAYFYHENKIVWLKKTDHKKHALDYTLEQIEEMLDPKLFFRLNRKYIASFAAIREVVVFSGSRLKVSLPDPPDKEPILISRERVDAFRKWLDQ